MPNTVAKTQTTTFRSTTLLCFATNPFPFRGGEKMCYDFLKYQVPEHWTAEQVEFLSNFLQDLNEALLAKYHVPLRHLWRERDRIAHIHQSDDQLKLFPPTQSG
jgi:hypothetical protein